MQDFFRSGILLKPRGFSGHIVFSPEFFNYEAGELPDKIFLEESREGEIEVLEASPDNNGDFSLLLKGYETSEKASLLSGKTVFLESRFLPPPPKEGFYSFEIYGFGVFDRNLGFLGTVIRVQNMPAQDCVELEYKGVKILIPLTRPLFTGIDRKEKRLDFDLPEGYFEALRV
jgi:16S rRNA processing protein RimM